VPIEVPDDKVSVRRADLARDVRSLVSYGVGCILGRYSLDRPGLVLADQGSTVADYLEKVPEPTLVPDADNILPITDAAWFEDDIVDSFYRFLVAAYGEDSLGDNVAFIEGALGCDLRTYFSGHFYADHLRVYQKRPIYWLFQSPRKSFSCLVYMHRYDESTVGEILTGYLRPLQGKLRSRIELLEKSKSARDAREANRLRAQVQELADWERDVIYPLAHERVSIDLDDGVKVNYNKFPHALAKVPGLSNWK
jgi:type II restriction/modification system DNA methylase subunit YeeA